MKCIFAIILFLLCNFKLSAQNDTIKVERFNEKSLSIDREKGVILSSSKIKLDSIDVDFIKYKDKVETNSTFKNRETSVSVEFYFESKNLILVYVKHLTLIPKNIGLVIDSILKRVKYFLKMNFFSEIQQLMINRPAKYMMNFMITMVTILSLTVIF